MAQNYFRMTGETRERAKRHLEEIASRLQEFDVKINVQGGWICTRYNTKVLEIHEKTTRDFSPKPKDELYLSLMIGSVYGRNVSETKAKKFNYDNICEVLREELVESYEAKERWSKIEEMTKRAVDSLPKDLATTYESIDIHPSRPFAINDKYLPAVRLSFVVHPDELVEVLEFVKPRIIQNKEPKDV